MDSYIVDTNFFFNLEIKSGFGDNPKEIIIAFTKLARSVADDEKAHFFMPPRIVEEFLTFVDEQEEYVKDFMTSISVQSPKINDGKFSAGLFYQLVDEVRDRNYKGLRVSEEVVDQVAQKFMGSEVLPKMEYQKAIGEHITKLRQRYRQATRVNFLDSVADLDLIVLAHELNGYIISSDEGVLRWGRLFGVKELAPHLFKQKLQQYL